METTKTLVLREPVQLGDTVISELTLGEPTVAQLEAALKESYNITSNIVLVSLVGKVPPAAVRKMKTRDFNEAVAFLSAFTDEKPPGDAPASAT